MSDQSDCRMQAAEATYEGDQAFHAGRLAEAGRAYHQALAADPDHVRALLGAGLLALSGNRLTEATTLLRKAVKRDPGDGERQRALQGLAEAAYRHDDFAASAGHLREWAAFAGSDERTRLQPVLAKLEGFDGGRPYRIEGGDRDVHVPFEITDPLPVLRVGLSDGQTVPFFIDTGGHEVYLDQGIAEALGLPSYGTVPALGAGGKTGEQGQARLDLLRLGELEVRDIPVATQDFEAQGYAKALGVPVKGVIGTALLYHFLATVDYVGGELILRQRTAERLGAYEREPRHAVTPFGLFGTHILLAEGAVGDAAPTQLMVDTGGAGVGFAGTAAGMRDAGIQIPTGETISGPGAGGTAAAIPFTVDRLRLGETEGRDLPGIYFPEGDFQEAIPAYTRTSFAGIVSHQFFRPYALTLDFTGMRLFLD